MSKDPKRKRKEKLHIHETRSKNKKILEESENNNVITTTNKSETRSSEIPQYLKKGNRLAFYNIICLFDNTFPYTKKMIEIFGDNQIKIFVEKWQKAHNNIEKNYINEKYYSSSLSNLIERYRIIINDNTNIENFSVNINKMITKFLEPPFDGEYKNEYNELLWCQDVLKNMGKELQRKRSTLIDNEASEYRYRDEIVNLLLAPIFHDVEEYIWLETGEIENWERKEQKNIHKKENEREKIGNKHDGILFMKLHGIKREVGFVEVVGNALIKNTSFKNDDLEKLLKVMMLAIWYKNVHYDYNESKLMLKSFGILVYGRKFYFLSMIHDENLFIVKEFDSFVIPDSGIDFKQMINVVISIKKFKLKVLKYYQDLMKFTMLKDIKTIDVKVPPSTPPHLP